MGYNGVMNTKTLLGLINQRVNLRKKWLRNGKFSGLTLIGANFSRCNLEGADFEGAMLPRVNFQSSRLTKINLSDGAFVEGDFRGVRDMAYSDISGAQLSKGLLVAVNLSHALANGVDLSEADLSRSVLSWSNFRVANLSKANLRGATITETALNSADLTGADLRGTAFYSSDLTGADLTDCIFDEKTIFKNCVLDYCTGDINGIISNRQ